MEKVEKAPREPQYLKEKMKLWRMGLTAFPVAYTDYHQGLAEERLEELKAKYGLRVLDVGMQNDGWGDSFRVMYAVVETRSQWPLKLIWNDSNRDFMVKRREGGQAALHPDKELT